MTDMLNSASAKTPQRTRRGGAWVAVLIVIIGAVIIGLLLGGALLVSVRATGVGSESYAADVNGVTAVDVDVSAASLTMTFADVPQATLDVESTGWRSDVEWKLQVDDGVLKVSDEARTRFAPSWGRGKVEAVLILPSALESRVDADLDLSAGDLEVSGDLLDVDLNASAGSLTFTGASTGLEIDVSAGDVTVETSGPQKVAIDVSAGRSVTTIGGPPPSSTTVEVSAGDAILDVPDAAYAVSGDASAGKRIIDVRTDPASVNRMDVKVSAGSAKVGYSG